MLRRTVQIAASFVLCLVVPLVVKAQANPDSATFDADGTAHITRLVPIPSTASPEAQAWLEEIEHQAPQTRDLVELLAHTDAWRKTDSAEARRLYPVNVEETNLAGVGTDIVTPLSIPQENKNRVLINFHGGGFISDSGSLIEGVPIAHLAKVRVVSVYYRLAPENPFPAAVDDGVAVYRELLKTYQPRNIGIFGTSAGATLTGEVAIKIKQLRLPLPGAPGMFSTQPDFSRPTDSQQLFALNGLSGNLAPKDPSRPPESPYAGNADRKDPVLSPIFADLPGMPPTLLVTSTRDLLLSDTAMFHLALLHAGVDSQLLVFEALPHAFWYHFQLPETKEALQLMATFLARRWEDKTNRTRLTDRFILMRQTSQ